MATPTMINHRRNRHEVRRVLAQLVVRGRDLTRSSFHEDIDTVNHPQPRRFVLSLGDYGGRH